jgi:hypothetical protein
MTKNLESKISIEFSPKKCLIKELKITAAIVSIFLGSAYVIGKIEEQERLAKAQRLLQLFSPEERNIYLKYNSGAESPKLENLTAMFAEYQLVKRN